MSVDQEKPQNLSKMRRSQSQPFPLLHHRQALISLSQTGSSITRLCRTLPPKNQIPVPLCSTRFVQSQHAAPESWTVAPARALSVSSTHFSRSLRTPWPDAGCSNAVSRSGFPLRHRPYCHLHSLHLLLHL